MRQCYVVINDALVTPTKVYGITYRQSYSTYTVGLLIKSSVLVLVNTTNI